MTTKDLLGRGAALLLLGVLGFPLLPLRSVSAQETEEQQPAAPTPEEVVSRVRRLIREGRAADAYRMLEQQGLALHPDDPGLLAWAGRALLETGYLDKSLEYLYKAVEAAPDSFEANLFLGMALHRHGLEQTRDPMTRNEGAMAMEDALGFLRKAAELDKHDPTPCLELARALNDLGAPEEADQAARDALARKPGLVEALLLRGDLAYVRYRNAGARGEPGEAVQAIWNQAMEFYKKAAEKDPECAQAYLGMAALLESDKRWRAAAEAYREALLRNPELLQGYNRLIAIFNLKNTGGKGEKQEGEAAEEKDTPEASLAHYLDTLASEIKERYPGDKAKQATVLYYLGFARFLEADYEKAAEAYAASAALNPSYATGAAYYRFRARYELGDHDRAAALFLDTARRDPDGLAYFMQNDREFTSKVYPALNYLAYHLVQKGRLADARDLNKAVLNVVKGDASLWNNYAFLCRESKQYEEAYAAYRKAIELDPENPSLLNDTAVILHYYLHRDLDEAEKLCREAAEKAKAGIDGGKLNQAQLEEYKIALRDSTNNLRLLKKGVLEEGAGGGAPTP